jgi:hypothetical protein
VQHVRPSEWHTASTIAAAATTTITTKTIATTTTTNHDVQAGWAEGIINELIKATNKSSLKINIKVTSVSS